MRLDREVRRFLHAPEIGDIGGKSRRGGARFRQFIGAGPGSVLMARRDQHLAARIGKDASDPPADAPAATSDQYGFAFKGRKHDGLLLMFMIARGGAA